MQISATEKVKNILAISNSKDFYFKGLPETFTSQEAAKSPLLFLISRNRF